MSEELELEKECVDLAETKGLLSRKLDVGPGAKGWIDRLFIAGHGVSFYVEFKTPDGRMSPKQEKLIHRLGMAGHSVYVVDNIEYFKRILAIYPLT